MHQYSKTSLFAKNKSRSVDFSDLASFSDCRPSKSITTLNSIAGERPTRLSFIEREEDDSGRKCRNSYVSSSGLSVIQSAVKRALSASMSRSSSVSERYCRIHDQPVTLSSPIDDDDDDDDEGGGELARKEKMRFVRKKKQRTAKIFKACKTLIGF